MSNYINFFLITFFFANGYEKKNTIYHFDSEISMLKNILKFNKKKLMKKKTTFILKCFKILKFELVIV